ncbi:hypothetical protein Bca101_018306 [Brassica carinata]
MALMVIASPLSCFRPPPDPPPYESPLFEDLSPIAPPEPPDPPDAVYVLVPLQIPNTSAKPSLQKFTQTFVLMLACPTMVTELNGSGAYLVSAGNTPFAYGRLFPVIYRSYFRGADWSSLRSYLDLPLQPLHVVLQVQLCLLLSAYFYTVEWVGIQVVWNTLDMWSLVLVDNVLMDIFSFSSILVPLSDIYVDSVRSRTAVCSFFLVSSLAFGAVILLFSSRGSWKRNAGISHLVNMVLMDMDFSVVSWLEHFIFPKFPLVWSELEAQALLVLQGSFSQLMLFSAFGAEMVILWITLDASIQEVYEIVMQFLWFLVVCVNSIPCFISFSLLLAFVVLLYPPLMEFEFF